MDDKTKERLEEISDNKMYNLTSETPTDVDIPDVKGAADYKTIPDKILQQLELTQTYMEQDIFDTLNQQDKFNKMFAESIEKITEFMAYVEAYEFQAVKFTEDLEMIKQHGTDNSMSSNMFSELDAFLKSLSDKQHALQDICTFMQSLTELESEISEVVHKLEDSITIHRNSIDNLVSHYKS